MGGGGGGGSGDVVGPASATASNHQIAAAKQGIAVDRLDVRAADQRRLLARQRSIQR